MTDVCSSGCHQHHINTNIKYIQKSSVTSTKHNSDFAGLMDKKRKMRHQMDGCGGRLTKLIKNMILIGLACFMALIIMVISWFHCQIGGHYLILSIITPLSVVLFVINLDLKIWLFYLTRVAWVSCRGYFLHVSLYRRKCANTAQVRGTQIKFTSRTVMNLSLCTSRCTLSSAWR